MSTPAGQSWTEAARDAQRTRLQGTMDEQALGALDEALSSIGQDATTIRIRFPGATRLVGRSPLTPSADPDDPFTVMADDVARTAMICALPAGLIPAELRELYRHGDSRERRGVLRALDAIPRDVLNSDADLRAAALGLVDDALRTNDIRLVAAALGPAGVAMLDDDAFAQAILKCVFVGVDIRRIPELPARTTPELSRMMADFVHERIAAGRPIAPAVWPVIDTHPPAEQLAAIHAELDSPVERRVDAARAALALRPDT